jgi:Protein of unknown function (DUF551)
MPSEAEIEAAAKTLAELNDAYAGCDESIWRNYMDDARAALAAAERVRWQPIEKMPTDEMFIYYWPRDGKRCIGLAYKAKDGGWRDSEGNWNVRLKPTHGMPLPSPPESGK